MHSSHIFMMSMFMQLCQANHLAVVMGVTGKCSTLMRNVSAFVQLSKCFFARLWTFSLGAADPEEIVGNGDDTKSKDGQAKPGQKDDNAAYLKLFKAIIENNDEDRETTLKNLSAYVETYVQPNGQIEEL